MHLGELVRPAADGYTDKFLAAVLPAGEVVERAEQIELDPLPRLVSSTRRFVLSQAPSLGADARDALELLTSELVTNAVIHARTSLRVGVIVSRHYVVVTVHDLDLGNSEINPELRDGGRGLALVELLAGAWDVYRGDAGKTVWFRLSRDPEGTT